MSDNAISIRRQCKLLDLTRSTLYYSNQPENEENLALMRLIDKQYTAMPYYGVRRMTASLRQSGYAVNPKRVRRLMRLMGLEAIYPKPNTSQANRSHVVYPYLLKGLKIDRPNQVWATDITYIPMEKGFVYLVAILDWHSRYVLSHRISTSLETGFCLEALNEALLKHPAPEIFNTDQGCQFTSDEWIASLKEANILISMDGRGRYLDNIFVERLWRTVKYEDVYIKRYETVKEVKVGLKGYFEQYNHHRLHQALGYKTPAQVYAVEKPLKTLKGLQQLSDRPKDYSKVLTTLEQPFGDNDDYLNSLGVNTDHSVA
jgi:putative transposase